MKTKEQKCKRRINLSLDTDFPNCVRVYCSLFLKNAVNELINGITTSTIGRDRNHANKISRSPFRFVLFTIKHRSQPQQEMNNRIPLSLYTIRAKYLDKLGIKDNNPPQIFQESPTIFLSYKGGMNECVGINVGAFVFKRNFQEQVDVYMFPSIPLKPFKKAETFSTNGLRAIFDFLRFLHTHFILSGMFLVQ